MRQINLNTHFNVLKDRQNDRQGESKPLRTKAAVTKIICNTIQCFDLKGND